MGFKVNTNMDALNAYYALSKLNAQTTKSQIRLATGKQINHVWDDTSGFTVGNQLATKAKILRAVQGNISSGKDMLSTAESALLNIKDLVTQIKTKISDATNPVTDRESIAKDIAALGSEIYSIFKSTKFNDTTLLIGTMATGTGSSKFEFQVSDSSSDKLILDFASGLSSAAKSTINVSATQTEQEFLDYEIASLLSSIMTIGIDNMDPDNNGVTNDLDYALSISSIGNSSVGNLGHIGGGITNYTFGGQNVSAIDKLENEVDSALNKIGNFAQRLTYKSDFFDVAIANAESSVSRLFDTDYALEQLNATKGSIMQQGALSMMAQLSMAPQSVLSLFQ